MTNASGNIVAGADTRYYPFGEARVDTGPMVTDKLFTGQRQIAGLGIYHYGARFYSPKLGRFLSADTIVPGYANPQNLNRFSYVTNNPLRYIDPTGHSPCEMYQGQCVSENQMTQIYNNTAGNGNNKPDDDDDDDDDSGGGGGHPLLSPTSPEGGTYSTPALPPLPPSPFACGWLDCGLSVVSFIASAFTLSEVALVPAVIVDLAATGWAIIRTNEDRSQGEINAVQHWALNGTAALGLIPGPWGMGFSFINILVTLSGYPP